MGNQTVRGSLVSDNLSDIWLSAHFGSGLKGNQWGTKQFGAPLFLTTFLIYGSVPILGLA